MRTLEEYKKDYYSRRPFDFADNPYQIEYFHQGEVKESAIGTSDISAHLPLLEFLARMCDHITEFGVREGFSTTAFLSGKPKVLRSYDLNPTSFDVDPESIKPTDWRFQQQNTIDPNFVIEQTDLLFIDTLHTFNQVQQELALHHKNVRTWIVFHDTVAHGEVSKDIPGVLGITKAITGFLRTHKDEWEMAYESRINNGLIVIERKR